MHRSISWKISARRDSSARRADQGDFQGLVYVNPRYTQVERAELRVEVPRRYRSTDLLTTQAHQDARWHASSVCAANRKSCASRPVGSAMTTGRGFRREEISVTMVSKEPVPITHTSMLRTFQQTDRRPAVICGSLCEETWILRSVREWKSSS